MVAIEITQSNCEYKCLITWNFIKNIELNSVELNLESHVLFDSEGEAYALQNDQVIVLKK